MERNHIINKSCQIASRVTGADVARMTGSAPTSSHPDPNRRRHGRTGPSGHARPAWCRACSPVTPPNVQWRRPGAATRRAGCRLVEACVALVDAPPPPFQPCSTDGWACARARGRQRRLAWRRQRCLAARWGAAATSGTAGATVPSGSGAAGATVTSGSGTAGATATSGPARLGVRRRRARRCGRPPA